jgi:hypothetical protein
MRSFSVAAGTRRGATRRGKHDLPIEMPPKHLVPLYDASVGPEVAGANLGGLVSRERDPVALDRVADEAVDAHAENPAEVHGLGAVTLLVRDLVVRLARDERRGHAVDVEALVERLHEARVLRLRGDDPQLDRRVVSVDEDVPRSSLHEVSHRPGQAHHVRRARADASGCRAHRVVGRAHSVVGVEMLKDGWSEVVHECGDSAVLEVVGDDRLAVKREKLERLRASDIQSERSQPEANLAPVLEIVGSQHASKARMQRLLACALRGERGGPTRAVDREASTNGVDEAGEREVFEVKRLRELEASNFRLQHRTEAVHCLGLTNQSTKVVRCRSENHAREPSDAVGEIELWLLNARGVVNEPSRDSRVEDALGA